MRMKLSSSASMTSSGKTSSLTKSRIHRSFSSNSGSVEKSQAIVSCLPGFVEQPACLGDEIGDSRRALFVDRIGPLAPPVQHQVVAEDAGVLVVGQGQVPEELPGLGAVHAQELLVGYVDGPG